MTVSEAVQRADKAPGVHSMDEFSCLYCKKVLATAKKCRKCRVAFYCGKECRRSDWLNGHNVKCVRTFKKHENEILEKNEGSMLLRQDHARVDALFRALPVQSMSAKKELSRAIIEELARHTNVEEQLLYPFLRSIHAAQKRPSGDA